MKKRGQVTLFIILALLIVLITWVVFTFVSKSTQEKITPSLSLQSESRPAIILFTQNCLELSTIKGLEHVLARGGYEHIGPTIEVFDFPTDDILTIPSYFKHESQIPSLEEIEKATAAALLPHFISCVNHFKVFDSLTIIEPVDPIVRVSFIEDTTKVNLQYQLTVLQENSFEVNEFEVEIPFDFKSTHTAVEEYLRRQEEDPNYFLVGDLSSLTQNEATLQFTQFGEEGEGVLIDLVYSEEKPLIYSFGLTFDWELGEEIDIEIEEPTLTIKQIPDWQINSPGIHTLQIEVEGEDLFFDISPRNGPTIDQNGILTFDTTGYENDEYLYYIEVTDIIDQRQVAPILVNMKMLGQNHLKIIPIGKIKMNIGEELKYQVTTNMQGVTFSSSSPLIVLDEDSGEFNILADEGNIGTHSVRIDARTQTDQTWERFSVEIK